MAFCVTVEVPLNRFIHFTTSFYTELSELEQHLIFYNKRIKNHQIQSDINRCIDLIHNANIFEAKSLEIIRKKRTFYCPEIILIFQFFNCMNMIEFEKYLVKQKIDYY